MPKPIRKLQHRNEAKIPSPNPLAVELSTLKFKLDQAGLHITARKLEHAIRAIGYELAINLEKSGHWRAILPFAHWSKKEKKAWEKNMKRDRARHVKELWKALEKA